MQLGRFGDSVKVMKKVIEHAWDVCIDHQTNLKSLFDSTTYLNFQPELS